MHVENACGNEPLNAYDVFEERERERKIVFVVMNYDKHKIASVASYPSLPSNPFQSYQMVSFVSSLNTRDVISKQQLLLSYTKFI